MPKHDALAHEASPSGRSAETQSVLVCRVGRLDWYHSKLDRRRQAIGGGGFNNGDERGSECDNFLPSDGFLEGYVTRGQRFALHRVNPLGTPYAEIVMFFAVQPGGGEWLVGWYRRAELLEGYPVRTKGYGVHNMRARARDGVLLPFHLRTRVAAPPRGKGGIGQANVRYLRDPEGRADYRPWREAIDFVLTYEGDNLLVQGRTAAGRQRALLAGEDDEVYIEGNPVLSWHHARERNSKAAAVLRERARRVGMRCEVCRDDARRYDAAAERVLEVHHRKPLGSLKPGSVAKTRLADLALVCANCHRALHATGLSVARLAASLR
jgi:hypothetical protein